MDLHATFFKDNICWYSAQGPIQSKSKIFLIVALINQD